ncbi:Beta sliding clamp [bioreactor metagenome]|uniref:Beta sliding clamp n=1 Tax=bioreactor metagenome TaxID=1076179 RepID=A0A645AIL9_9ZZZZ
MGDCLDRAALLISEKQRSPIRIRFEGDTALFTCSSPLGRVSDEIPIKSSGGDLEMGFNNKFLQDALRYCGEDVVKLEMTTNLSPLVIRPTEGDSFIYLVLPVRLKNSDH